MLIFRGVTPVFLHPFFQEPSIMIISLSGHFWTTELADHHNDHRQVVQHGGQDKGQNTNNHLRSKQQASWWLNHPFEKYQLKWESSASRGEHKKCLSCHHLARFSLLPFGDSLQANKQGF